MEIVRQLNRETIKKLPKNLPSGFVRSRWENLVFTENGVNRKYYELCILSGWKVYNLLHYVKITDLLVEVDNWSGFTDSYTHLKSGEKTKDKTCY